MQRTLITGGAGFIGSNLVEKLLKKGNQVVVLDNLSTGRRSNLEPFAERIEFIVGDILDTNSLSRAMEGVSTVYHLGAEVGVDRVMKKSEKQILKIDLEGTRRVLDLSVRKGVKTFLFASSSEVYGKVDQKKLPISEDRHFTPDTTYGKAKLLAELLGKDYSRKNGMSVVSIRFFNVYGPGQSLNGYCVPNFINAALTSQDLRIHGDGTQTRDLTYVDDAVKLMISVCDRKFDQQAFNIGTGNSISMNDLAAKVIRLTGSQSKIKHVKKRRPTDSYHKCGDPRKIRQATGARTEFSLDEGLKKCIEAKKIILKKNKGKHR